MTAIAAGTTSRNPRQALPLVAFAAVASVTVVDVLCAQWLSGFQARRAVPLPTTAIGAAFPARQWKCAVASERCRKAEDVPA